MHHIYIQRFRQTNCSGRKKVGKANEVHCAVKNQVFHHSVCRNTATTQENVVHKCIHFEIILYLQDIFALITSMFDIDSVDLKWGGKLLISGFMFLVLCPLWHFRQPIYRLLHPSLLLFIFRNVGGCRELFLTSFIPF